MQGNTEPSTSSSLLFRLRDYNDREAWDEFVQRYGPKIFGWCRRHRLQDADAKDVTQDVLTKFAKVIRSFEYDRSRRFRGWLKTITNNAIRDAVKSRMRAGAGTGDSRLLEALEAIQAPEALNDLEEELATEHQRELELLEKAERQVRRRVEQRTWEAFRLTAKEGQPAAEVSKRFGISIAEVYVAKSRVKKMLRAEIAKTGTATLTRNQETGVRGQKT